MSITKQRRRLAIVLRRHDGSIANDSHQPDERDRRGDGEVAPDGDGQHHGDRRRGQDDQGKDVDPAAARHGVFPSSGSTDVRRVDRAPASPPDCVVVTICWRLSTDCRAVARTALRVEPEPDDDAIIVAMIAASRRDHVGQLPAVHVRPLEGDLDHPQRVDGGDDEPERRHDGHRRVRLVGAEHDQELADEVAEARQAQRGHGEEQRHASHLRHRLPEPAHLLHVARVDAARQVADEHEEGARVMPWASMIMIAPSSASSFQAKMPSSTKPMWLTLV